MSLEYVVPKTKDELISVLKEIDSYYQHRKDEFEGVTMQPLVLDRAIYLELSDEEIIDQAKTALAPLHTEEKLKRKNALEEKIEELDALLVKALTAKVEAENNARTDYENAMKKAKIDASAKGIEFSSLYSFDTSLIENEYSLALSKVQQDYDKATADIISKKTALNSEIDNLDEYFFNKHEQEVEAKVLSIKADREKIKFERLKYNNSIHEKEIKSNNDIKKTEAELLFEYMKIVVNGLSETELAVKGYYYEMIKAILDYYYSLSDKIGAYEEFVKEAYYVTVLGENYKSVVYLLYTNAYPNSITTNG